MGNCINKMNTGIAGVIIRPMIEKNKKSDNVDFSNNYIGERAMLSRSYCAYCGKSCSSVVTNKNKNKHKHKNECHDNDDDDDDQQQQQRRPFLICYDKTTETNFIRAACETCLWTNGGGKKAGHVPGGYGYGFVRH